MPTDVLAYLHSKGLQTKRADKKNVNLSCIFCSEPEGKRGRLYVNVDEYADIPGLFMCHLCGAKGSLRTLQRHYGDDTGTGTDPGVAHYEIMRAAAQHFFMALGHHPEVIQYYRDRGLTDETIKKHKLGWAEGDLVPALKKVGFNELEIKRAGFIRGDGQEFFNQVYTIPYFLGPTCVGVRQKEPGGKYKQPSGFVQRPYNVDSARGKEEIVITEGEFDSLIVEQMGFAAIGCPGATQWQESWNPYVRDAKTVYVVFDNDSAGRTGAEKAKETIGPRARALTIPGAPGGDDEDHNDISDWVVKQNHTAYDFTELLKKHKGSLLISIAEAMTEWESVQGVEGLKFGFELLDRHINPGLLAGQVVVALAKTNVGKTLWLENTFERMAMADPDTKFLFMSLEQTRGEWFERAQRIRGFYRHKDLSPTSFEPEDIQVYKEQIKQVTYDFWNGRLLLTDANRMNEESIRETLDDYELEMGCKPDVLAIDYLGYLARGFPGKDQHEKVAAAIMTLKGIGKEYKIPILVPSQSNRSGQFGQRLAVDMARDAGEVEETADFVFVLYDPDHGKKDDEPKLGTTNLYIGKSRHGGKDKEVFYQFARRTLTMVPSDDKFFYQRASYENSVERTEPWEWAIVRHRYGKRPSLGDRT